LPEHAREETATVVLESHAVRDFSKAVRLGKCGQMSENLSRLDFAPVAVPVRMRAFALQ
jgi:hypothetical protein